MHVVSHGCDYTKVTWWYWTFIGPRRLVASLLLQIIWLKMVDMSCSTPLLLSAQLSGSFSGQGREAMDRHCSWSKTGLM